MECITNFPICPHGKQLPNILPLIKKANIIVIKKHGKNPDEYYTEDNEGI